MKEIQRGQDKNKEEKKSEHAEVTQGNENIIIGRNPVMEALKSGREIEKLMILKDAEGSIKKIIGMAKEKKLHYQLVDKAALERIADGRVHQGVAAVVSNYEYCDVEDLLEKAREKGEDPFLIILDGIEDPHNLGAIIRTADGAGAHGIIIPKRRAAGITDVVVKASAGAVEYVPVAKVSNIAQTVDKLKELGVWVGACDMGGTEYHKADLRGKIALVIGAEGEGISRLVKEKCDFSLSIPMCGTINSLNASNAAAILMYEVRRQRNRQRYSHGNRRLIMLRTKDSDRFYGFLREHLHLRVAMTGMGKRPNREND